MTDGRLSVNVSYADASRTLLEAESIAGGVSLSIVDGQVVQMSYLDFMEWAGTVTKMMAQEQGGGAR